MFPMEIRDTNPAPKNGQGMATHQAKTILPADSWTTTSTQQQKLQREEKPPAGKKYGSGGVWHVNLATEKKDTRQQPTKQKYHLEKAHCTGRSYTWWTLMTHKPLG